MALQVKPAPIKPRRGFTIMELMVSITILIAIILAVNISFTGATQAVSGSQATMDLMGNVRATQLLVERDLRGLDRNSFLVIRSRLANPSATTDFATGLTYAQESLHFDQISFISLGQFQNPTGANTSSPFTDSSTAAAAQVWYGQLIMEKLIPPDPSYNVSNQATSVTQKQLPTGAWGGAIPTSIKESEFVLGRHLTLLFPGPADVTNQIKPTGQQVLAYPSTALNVGTIFGLDGAADISSSRYDVAATTPEQIMLNVIAARAGGALDPEADLLTYRFRALQSVYDTEVGTNPFVNGAYRMSPVVMGGVSSFKVEWSDGAIYPAGYLIGGVNVGGQMKWYGPTLPNGGAPVVDPNNPGIYYGFDNTLANTSIEQWGGAALTSNASGDQYVATFSYFNKSSWPKALRFTYHVYGDRLGGRDVVQVVNLP